MNKKVKKVLASIIAIAISGSMMANFAISASAASTITTPINYVGYVNFMPDAYSGGYNYTNYVRAAESYDTRDISFDGVVAGPWATSTPAVTDVLDSGSLWSTTLTFANFDYNIYFPNIYRLKFTRTSTVFSIDNYLQDPIVVLAKLDGSTVNINDYNTLFQCGKVALGDVDGDGVLSTADTNKIYQYYSGTISLSNVQMVAADIDFNGVINASDRAILLNLLNGTISSLW